MSSKKTKKILSVGKRIENLQQYNSCQKKKKKRKKYPSQIKLQRGQTLRVQVPKIELDKIPKATPNLIKRITKKQRFHFTFHCI